MKNYRLATGISDKHRLKILNEIYNPSSLAFLDEHVLRIEKPISILEIGCGHGHMTCILAKALSVNGGTITGRDISENQLEIARDIAKPNKLGNISFERSDISFQDKAEDFFDCTYSRFLLMHLHNRTESLKSISESLAPNGISIFEEPCLSSQFCHPYFPEFYEANALTIKLGEKLNLNYNNPISLLDEISKFYHIEALNISQPTLATHAHKQIIHESFKQISKDLLSYALCSEADSLRIAESLYNFSCSPNGFASGLRVLQVKARRR
ncbi:class I SAM-dependent methyltransferase [Pseudomonas putida]|uniref:class I SAM-dependent methyltransferase n=1 Tax=Pseudomonas putida TaxID=303 RepID=UPI0009BCDDE8|nr:class I SAM-dependent methyltransferase [Pseudomonas putida]